MMDVKRLEHEMRLLAEAKITDLVGAEQIVLTKSAAARICNRSLPWVDAMIARGRLPTVRVGGREVIQRPALVEALVYGV